MNRLRFNVLSFLLLLVTSSSAFSAEKLYSWKKVFPMLPHISSSELKQKSDQLVLVDVRPKFEFDKKHKAGVQHISFSSRMFMLQMENLIESNKGKTIVVYCQEKNCVKSYRAVNKCQKARLKNVVLFDLQAERGVSEQDAIYSQLNATQF